MSLTPLSLIFRIGLGVFLFLKMISSVLVAFNDILLASNQWFRDLRSLLRFLTGFLFRDFDLSTV